jgi:hypothetical protein
MQRFFFDFSDSTHDDVGTECDNLEMAVAEAKCALLITAAETCSPALAVAIRDQAGQQVSRLTVSVATERS